MRTAMQLQAAPSLPAAPHPVVAGRRKWHTCPAPAPASAATQLHQSSAVVCLAQNPGQQGGPLGFLGRIFGGGNSSREVAPQPPQLQGSRQQLFMNAESNQAPELPPFTTVVKTKDYALRLYQSYPVVEMAYEQRQEGYASLGSYIDGENEEDVRFAYTQPVVMVYGRDGKGRKYMQMAVGSRAGAAKESPTVIASLPAPKSPGVSIKVAGGELLAVATLEGYITPIAAERTRATLVAALRRDGVKLSAEAEAGAFSVGQFGALFQLAGRYNELYLKVQVTA